MGKDKTPPPVYTAEEEAALRRAISDGFMTYTRDAEARGVTYSLGAKDGVKSIDCAGFIDQAARTAFGNLENGGGFVDDKALAIGGDNQIRVVGSRPGGVLLTGNQVNLKNLKEGMILGIDKGPVPWAPPPRKLWNEISHVALIYRDPEKGLMVAQANIDIYDPADKKLHDGVHAVPLDFWLHRMQNNPKVQTLYAADMVPMAKSYGAKAADGTQPVVAAAAQTTTPAATTATTPAATTVATAAATTVDDSWLGNKPVPNALQAFRESTRNGGTGEKSSLTGPMVAIGAALLLCMLVSWMTSPGGSSPQSRPTPG